MGVKSKIFIVLLAVAISSFFYLREEGDFESLKTHHKFRIYKDDRGIPRIYAKDKLSTFYALGFSEAQDRLWTLFLRKMMIQGRMS